MIGADQLLAAQELATLDLEAGFKEFCARERIDYDAFAVLIDGQARRWEHDSSRPAITGLVAGFMLGLAVSRQRELFALGETGENNG